MSTGILTLQLMLHLALLALQQVLFDKNKGNYENCKSLAEIQVEGNRVEAAFDKIGMRIFLAQIAVGVIFISLQIAFR